MNALSVESFDFSNLIITNSVKEGLITFNGNPELDAIRILDINGKILFEQNNFSEKSLQFNLKPAVYFFILERENLKECRKIVVK